MKLQIQNEEFSSDLPQIFKGLSIWVNGNTEPTQLELRNLIVARGGLFHFVLDRKSLVTHIIATNLTPKKVLDDVFSAQLSLIKIATKMQAVEFREYKIVLPNWITESIAADRLLPWAQFRWTPSDGYDAAQGTQTGQTRLSFPVPIAHSRLSANMPRSASKVALLSRSPSPEPLLAQQATTASTSAPEPLAAGTLRSKDITYTTKPGYAAHPSNQ